MFYGLINKKHIKEMVTEIIDLIGGDLRAIELILGTIAQETHLGGYIDPTPFTAGSGLCQIDLIAFQDIKTRTNKKYKDIILHKLGINLDKVTYPMLEYNPTLSIIFCRLFYKLIPKPIPVTLEGQAKYWKKYYNTEIGKGSVEEYLVNYAKLLG